MESETSGVSDVLACKSNTASRNGIKKRKPGIIYLSTIPKYMNVIKIREIFGEYGEVGRVFLQPSIPGKPGSKKTTKIMFTEGWVEFQSKRVAKQVAVHLNNKQIGGRKKSKFYDNIWNIKYLPRFKWVHLSERLAYEKAAHRQRMRLEMSQARKEATHFALSVDKSERIKKKSKKSMDMSSSEQNESVGNDVIPYAQRKTESEILSEKKLASNGDTEDSVEDRTQLLKSWFGGV